MDQPTECLARLIEWVMSDDSCPASRAIVRHMMFQEGGEGTHPCDPIAFGGCAALLEVVPQWRPRMKEMGRYSVEWTRLAEHWPALTELYESGRGLVLPIKRVLHGGKPVSAFVLDDRCRQIKPFAD